MNDLVEVKNSEILVDSHLVAKKFEMKHKDLIISANKVIAKIEKLTGGVSAPKYYIEQRHYRGTDFNVYLMTREFFSLVAMRLTSQRAFEWQVKFNEAFYSMEKRLLQVEQNTVDVEWNSSRLIGKTARLEETDAIKEFAEYATNQGSKNAGMYYKHVTNASYKALGMIAGKHPKLRDEMNLYQLSELMLAERLAASKLREYMELDREYHDIFSSVKQDLIDFANSIRLN
jgi:phage regulator Rha-like protein